MLKVIEFLCFDLTLYSFKIPAQLFAQLDKFLVQPGFKHP